MQIERGAIRLGAEIEVAAWKSGTYQDVAKGLRAEGYMIGNDTTWAKFHDYHCECVAGGCDVVRSGRLVDPPLVSMTYDGTLPDTGAEFIMSPVLMDARGMAHFERVWSTVSEKAEWRNDIEDKYGRLCSPSVHLHLSASLGTAVSRSKTFQEEILHALSLFSPEFFALADTAGPRRGLAYRLPDRFSMANEQKGFHHGFIEVRQAVRNKYVYIEWRLFEAAYDNWPYVETASYLAAGLTRGLLSDEVFSQLISTGYANPYSDKELRKAVVNNDVDLVLAQVNPDRLAALRRIVVSNLDDDDYGRQLVADWFEKVGA